MPIVDHRGHPLSGANADARQHLESAVHQSLCFVDNPIESLDLALAASPECTMAHATKAWLCLLGTEPAGNAQALQILDGAAGLPADQRERAHLAAARLLAEGRWQAAGLAMEDLSARWPRDVFALQVGHAIDFFRGDSRMLRDRIARALPAWAPDLPGWHAVLGMHAFGLEETGDYAAAEAAGTLAVELQPRDAWAWHAVAHVYEMRNMPAEGIAWLQPNRQTWSQDSYFAVHNTWHLAMFHLELDRHDEALGLYDEAIGGPGSEVVMDLIDASALLWRLWLRGVNVGSRFELIAQRWLAVGGFGRYAFNDLHAMLAFAACGHRTAQQQVLDAQQLAMTTGRDNATMTREVGHPASRAILALADGQAAAALALLRPIRNAAARFGGSHAQRDLLDLSMIEAALRADNQPMASALVAERIALRPRSPLVQRWARRTGILPPPPGKYESVPLSLCA